MTELIGWLRSLFRRHPKIVHNHDEGEPCNSWCMTKAEWKAEREDQELSDREAHKSFQEAMADEPEPPRAMIDRIVAKREVHYFLYDVILLAPFGDSDGDMVTIESAREPKPDDVVTWDEDQTEWVLTDE